MCRGRIYSHQGLTLKTAVTTQAHRFTVVIIPSLNSFALLPIEE
jgi:hypothetical protein